MNSWLRTGFGVTALTAPTTFSSTRARRIHVDQVVEVDPGQPLATIADPSTEAGQENGPQELEHPAAGREHDARPHRHDTQAGVAGSTGSPPPTGRPRRRGSRRRSALLRRGVRRPGLGRSTRSPMQRAALADAFARTIAVGEPAGRLDPARVDGLLVSFGEATGDRRAGEVHDRVDVLEDAGIGIVWVPGAFVVSAWVCAGRGGSPGGPRSRGTHRVRCRPARMIRSRRRFVDVGSRRRRSDCTSRSSRSWVCR